MPDTLTPKAALARVRRLETKLEEAWRDVAAAVVAAADGGASYSQIGASLGLSKQRVGDLAKAGRRAVR